MTPTNIHYYDIQKNWRKLKPWFDEGYIIETAHKEMEDYSEGKAETYGFPYRPKKLTKDWKVSDYDGCDWRFSDPGLGRPGRKPKYWDWVCHGACHWVNNVGMLVASFALPKYDWRIVQSDLHTTVWDGKDTLFDLNFLALGVSPEDAWELAAEQPDSIIQPINLVPLHY